MVPELTREVNITLVLFSIARNCQRGYYEFSITTTKFHYEGAGYICFQYRFQAIFLLYKLIMSLYKLEMSFFVKVEKQNITCRSKKLSVII